VWIAEAQAGLPVQMVRVRPASSTPFFSVHPRFETHCRKRSIGVAELAPSCTTRFVFHPFRVLISTSPPQAYM
jgi:hypothetical protein